MTSRPKSQGSRHERHLRIASEISGLAPDAIRSKFTRSRVLLTGQAETLATERGWIMLITAANLVARFCPKIDIAIPRPVSGLGAEAMALLKSIDSSAEAEFRLLEVPSADAQAALAIGPIALDIPNLTSIDSRGWLAFVHQGALPTAGSSPRAVGIGNPFGALVAAGLGAAEVFKHLLDPPPGKVSFLGTASLSAYDYSVGGDDPGPDLPAEIRLPRSLLAGVGAVGNALLLALSHLPSVTGDLIAVDNETVDSEATNLNRYTLAIETDTLPGQETPKTELAVRLFRGSGLRIEPHQRRVEEVLELIYRGEIPRPAVILSAVDNNECRYRLQKLWPDLLLEGATDRTLARVSRHEYGTDLACLMCIHSRPEPPQESVPYIEAVATRTGLSPTRIRAAERDASLTVLDVDITEAPPERREFLSERIGRPICGVLTETASLSTNPQAPPQVAVSFTSHLAGVLQAAELVKYSIGATSSLETFFDIDPMFPLVVSNGNAALQTVRRSARCYCSYRQDEIMRYRATIAPDSARE